MALATLSYGIWPAPIQVSSAGSMVLDASGEKAAFIWRVGKAGDIRKLHFRLGTVATGQTLKLSLQDVDPATGDPDGTIDQSGTVAVANTDDDTWKTVTLGSDRTVARGDWLAAVIEFDSTVGSLVVARDSVASAGRTAYADLFTGAWAKTGASPVLAVEYSDGSFGMQPGVHPGFASSQAFNVNTAGGDEYALRFRLPFPARCSGLCFYGSIAGDMEFVLYDSDGSTALATLSFDASLYVTGNDLTHLFWGSDVSLAKDTWYRIAAKPTTTTNFTLRFLDLFSAAAAAQLPGGTNAILSRRVDAGSWTDVDTQRPALGVLLDQADDGVSAGGGLLRHPGMGGGCVA